MKRLHEALPLAIPVAALPNEVLMTAMYASRMLAGEAHTMLRPHGLTEAQFNVLMLLDYQFPEGTSQVRLSRCLVVNKANVTGLIDRMVRDDLVRRDPHPGDRRKHVVRMTKEGKRRLRGAAEAYAEVLARVGSDFSAAELADLVAKLLRLAHVATDGVEEEK